MENATQNSGCEGVNFENCEPVVNCSAEEMTPVIDHGALRYPFCVVWTPIPFLTWLFPVIGHMGIATSKGIIRDFAGPCVVSEDRMAFGNPTKYWQLSPLKAKGGTSGWDSAVYYASEEYKTRMHNLCCDNCHSHVAYALNMMNYDDSKWNMVKIWFLFLLHGKYVRYVNDNYKVNKHFLAWIKSWLPFFIVVGIIGCMYAVL